MANAMLIHRAYGHKQNLLTGKVEDKILSHPDLSTTPDGECWLITEAHISSFGSRTRLCKADITIPGQLLPGGGPQYRLMPYGEWFTTKIAQHLFQRDWLDRQIAVIPGEFWFDSLTEFNFTGKLEPRAGNDVSSLLIISSSPMTWYGGLHGLITLEFGGGLYGMVLPLNYAIGDRSIFTGLTILDIYDVMEYGLRLFLGKDATATA